MHQSMHRTSSSRQFPRARTPPRGYHQPVTARVNSVGETNMAMPSYPSQLHGQPAEPFDVRRRRLQPFTFRPFQRHPARTLATMQAPATPSSERDPVEIGFEHGGSQLITSNNEPFLFDQFLQYPEDSSISQWRLGDVTNPLFNGSFSTSSSFDSMASFGSANSFSSHSTFGSGSGPSNAINDSLPSKIETSPTMPTPILLSQTVDTSQYDNVENEDWMLSSIEYDAPSPASLGSLSNDPSTPVSPRGGDAFLRYPMSSSHQTPGLMMGSTLGYDGAAILPQAGMPVFDQSNNSFHKSCKCPACTGDFPEHAPLAAIWNAAQPPPLTEQPVSHHSHAHGLPFVTQNGFQAPAVQGVASLGIETAGMSTDALPSLDRHTLETSPEQGSESDSDSEPDVNDHAVAEAAHRRDRDLYLLRMREKGYSYKEIKSRGNFSEAESTLRGRVRVLTKDKSQRVRKPEWTKKDLDLLNKAVRRFSGFDGSSRDRNGRMPWKKVSEWMSKKGSTYVFAPATCAKKFKELN